MTTLKLTILNLLLLLVGLPIPIGNGEIKKIPEKIAINEKALHPEGIDYNPKNNRFIIGSFTKSEVGHVDPDTGAYTTFIEDKNLASVTGVYVDMNRNRLLVSSGKAGAPANRTDEAYVAYLGIYNLDTGNLIKGIDLRSSLLGPNAPAFANDIAVDDNGNIYVTDSFSPVIYKVDGNSFEASIFAEQARFAAAPGEFGLNGIVYTNGNLIVSKSNSGELFKIPVSNPENTTVIETSKYVWADGLELDSKGNLVVVVNGSGKNPGTVTLVSKNNWKSATEASYFPVPAVASSTTAALANDGNVYAITSYFGKLFSADYDLSHETFEILRIK